MERLQDYPQAEQFIRLLLDVDRQREANECRYLLEQIDDLERQLETVGRELRSLKGQLKKAERGTPERWLKTTSRRVEREVREAKEQIREIKDSILSGMGKAVRNFKRKGAAALDGAIDKLHIRVALRSISRSMERTAINMQETLDRISAASAESQQTKIHKKNISRVLFGKEREEIPKEFTPGILAKNAIRPFAAIKGLCEGICKQADGLEERMVKLSRYAGMDKEEEKRKETPIPEQQEFQEQQMAGQEEFQGEPVREWRSFREVQRKENKEVQKQQPPNRQEYYDAQTPEWWGYQEAQILEGQEYLESQMPEQMNFYKPQEGSQEIEQKSVWYQTEQRNRQAANEEKARKPETIQGLQEYKKSCKQKNQARRRAERMEL